MKTAALAAVITMAVSGLAFAQDYRYYDRGYEREFDRGGMRIARDYGFEDGNRIAYDDMARGKPYQPYPRHNPEDRGYRREYGDKNEYRAVYADAYRDGYAQAFHRYRR